MSRRATLRPGLSHHLASLRTKFDKHYAHLERQLEKTERRAERLERTLASTEQALENAKAPPPVTLDYPSANIVLDGSTKLARKRKNATSKEPRTVAWIESLPAGDVLFDVGANVGAYSLIAAKRPQGALRVVAFEPAFSTFGLLCRNVVANGAGDQVTPLPVTLGGRTELGHFGYSTLTAGAGLQVGLGGSLESTYGGDGESAYDQPVLVFTLDDLIERFVLPFPQHVKLDVDGAEVEILRGATRTLSDPRLKTILAEVFARYEDEVDEIVTGCGLRRTDTLRAGAAHGQPFLYALYER
jgi:FkbM family methyltransferase